MYIGPTRLGPHLWPNSISHTCMTVDSRAPNVAKQSASLSATSCLRVENISRFLSAP